MKSKILGLLAVGLLAPAVHATSYTFTFRAGASEPLITGSFDGTDDGTFVTGLSNIKVFWDGTQILGASTVYANSRNSSQEWVSGGARAGFLITNNNFIFTDCDYTSASPCTFSGLFDSAPYWPGYSHYTGANNGVTFTDGNSGETNYETMWSLTRVGTPVPEPATLALLGLGLAGLGLSRRREI